MTKKRSIFEALMLLVLMIIMGYCTINAASSCFQTDSIYYTPEVDFSGERLFSDSNIESADAAAGSILRSKFSFTRIGREKRSSKEEYRTYFYSVLAVLVKTAAIPEYILITVIGAGYLKAGIRRQLMSFIHDTDGKKERGTLLPV